MWLWGASRGRSWASVRRSTWFEGLIPHFGVFRNRGRFCVATEYIPNRRRGDPKSSGDVVILFKGVYRVIIYRRIASVTADTYSEALTQAFKLARKVNHEARVCRCFEGGVSSGRSRRRSDPS